MVLRARLSKGWSKKQEHSVDVSEDEIDPKTSRSSVERTLLG